MYGQTKTIISTAKIPGPFIKMTAFQENVEKLIPL